MSYKRELYIGSPETIKNFMIWFGWEEYNRLMSLEEEGEY